MVIMKKILTFVGSGGSRADISKWRKFEFQHTDINYEKIITHLDRADNLKINLTLLDSSIDLITSGKFDAVFCEPTEGMLFRFVA